MDSRSKPFDGLAAGYDHAFTDSVIACLLRGNVHQRLHMHFGAGQHVLELGCGTGQDALHLAQHGVHVTATDASEAMLAQARAKTADYALVTVLPLDLGHLDQAALTFGEASFEGAFANFGPLNCVGDWRPLAQFLAGVMRPGGVAGFAVMSPFCVWEMAWHGLHGDLRTAARRLRGQAVFMPQDADAPMSVFYPTVRRLTRDFAGSFERIHVMPLGLFLPPSDVYRVVEKHPRMMAALMRLEQSARWCSPLAMLSDHYWIEFRRR